MWRMRNVVAVSGSPQKQLPHSTSFTLAYSGQTKSTLHASQHVRAHADKSHTAFSMHPWMRTHTQAKLGAAGLQAAITVALQPCSAHPHCLP